MELKIKVTKEGRTFKAYCRELDIVSYGDTKKSSLKRIKAIIDFYIELAVNQGIEIDSYRIIEEVERHKFSSPIHSGWIFSLSDENYLN